MSENTTYPVSPYILKLPALMRRVGKSRSSIYRDIANGLFPAPVKIGVRSVGWMASAIADWEASLQSTRHPVAA
ncbi:AlpA family phage regulatory protein [Rhodoferax sp.]|uniref:helix-turn-helix transcriptional regulator n=1 Tax=Rhodoferax sp. TaxID=50421 RepID=UPI002852363D|nr:AlpA family phage regulatory protein [Rhodoferax sp.]MDR3371205.1 AlpA family phage regulatory protein [Rhodoferax sp.]